MPRPATGTIVRRKDGRFAVALTLPTGKRLWRYARTERDARRLLDRLKRELVLGQLAAPTPVTLAEWLERDRALRERHGVRAATLATERDVLGTLLKVSGLGRLPLHRLTPLVLATAFAELATTGMGSRRQVLAYTCLRASLERARRLALIPTNPLQNVPRPRHTPREPANWTLADVQRFVAVAASVPPPSPCRYAPLLAFIVLTGLRFSEAIALTWDDVHWDGDVPVAVSVRRALVWVRGHVHTEAPKSAQSRRTVSLPTLAQDILRRAARERVEPAARIFSGRGGAVPRGDVVGRQLAALCERAGVPRRTVHGLRSVHASLLAAGGLDVKTAQGRLGHASARMTLDTYARQLRPDAEAAALLDRLLNGVNGVNG